MLYLCLDVTVNVNVAYNAMGRRGRQNGAVTERGVEAKTNCECEEVRIAQRVGAPSLGGREDFFSFPLDSSQLSPSDELEGL